jgi:hypothetical protein
MQKSAPRVEIVFRQLQARVRSRPIRERCLSLAMQQTRERLVSVHLGRQEGQLQISQEARLDHGEESKFESSAAEAIDQGESIRML